jgi:hypothetical protein
MRTFCFSFQLSLSFCMPFFPKIAFLSDSAYFQQAPNTDMCLILSHLTLVGFIDLSCDHLELLCELCCLRLGLCSLLLKCVQYLHCNIVTDHPCALYLGLCHIHFCFLCLCNELCCSLLEWFYLSPTLIFLCLRSYEVFLQFLHILYSFDALCDWHCLQPLLEGLDSCAYPFSFQVPLLDLLILLHLRPDFCFFLEQVGRRVDLSLYLLYLRCFLLLPLFLHLQWSGRCEILLEVLDILLILIDCLHNLINLLCYREFNHLCVPWYSLIGCDQFLHQSIRAVLLIFGLELILLEYQFQCISSVLFLL